MNDAATTYTGPLGSTLHVLRADAETVAALAAVDWNRHFRRVWLDPVQGIITLMAPSHLHEDLTELVGQIVDAAGSVLSGTARGIRSTRLRGPGEPPGTGMEPDGAFYVGARAKGYLAARREGAAEAAHYVLRVAPDLVVETEITNIDEGKIQRYADLGVRELWRLRGRRSTYDLEVDILALRACHPSRKLAASQVLEGLTPDDVCEAVEKVGLGETAQERMDAVSAIVHRRQRLSAGVREEAATYSANPHRPETAPAARENEGFVLRNDAATTHTGPLGSTLHVLRADADTVSALAAVDWNRHFRRVRLDPVLGIITLMAPSNLHENLTELVDKIVDVAGSTLAGAVSGLRHTRLRGRGEPPGTGMEPDGAFYIGERARAYLAALREGVAAAEDFVVRVAPDLIVETEVTSFDEGKIERYADLGVRELWRLRGRKGTYDLAMVILALRAGSPPRKLAASAVFEGLTPDDVCEAVAMVRLGETARKRMETVEAIVRRRQRLSAREREEPATYSANSVQPETASAADEGEASTYG